MVNLSLLAKQVMTEWGLQPEFPEEAVKQVAALHAPAPWPEKYTDLRSLLWCSIDNDDSHDLDQLTYGESGPEGFTLWIAVADVGALVPKSSPVDRHAQLNTTSVYTPARIFPMLPEKLSTNLTSLNENEERCAIVTKIEVDQNGEIGSASIFQAVVRNYAQLAYNAVGAWLAGTGEMPAKIGKVAGLDQVLRTQHEAAQRLKLKRHKIGSLTFDTSKVEAKVIASGGIRLEVEQHNFAHQLIEEFMIAANFCLA